MVTRNLRVTNFWPGLIVALTVLWSVVSSRVRLVCPRAVEGRGKRALAVFGSVLLSARFHIGPQLASRSIDRAGKQRGLGVGLDLLASCALNENRTTELTRSLSLKSIRARILAS